MAEMTKEIYETWNNARNPPKEKGHYRVLLDDNTVFRAYYHPYYGWSKMWQKLTRVEYWRVDD